MDYFYVDVETVPIDKGRYSELSEEERKKLLNPIDSRIIAIGVQKNADPIQIFAGEDEGKILAEFWSLLASRPSGSGPARMVGFNIKDFDLPFLVTRSFLKGVKIHPFLLKDVMDVREQVAAFKYGPTRGKLKEYAALLGMAVLDDMDGSQVAERYWKGELPKIVDYLRRDVELTRAMHVRMVELRISEIGRW